MKTERNNKKGAALIYVLLLTVLVIILGTGILQISYNSYKLATNEKTTEQAYLTAKSGLNFFLNALNKMSSDELKDLYTKIKDNYPNTTDADVNLTGTDYDAGNLKIVLAYDIDNDRINIKAISSVDEASATVNAYLEKNEVSGGFDFDLDKPFYVYGDYTNPNNDVSFGTYKGEYNNDNAGKLGLTFTTSIFSSTSDEYAKVLSDKSNLTVKLADAFAAITMAQSNTTVDYSYSAVSGCVYKSSANYNNDGHYDSDYYWDIKYLNCRASSDFTTSRNQQYISGLGKYAYAMTFDFDYTVGVDTLQIGQDIIYLDPLKSSVSNFAIIGEKFYADDVVYVSLRNPSDLSKLYVDESDSSGGYEYKFGARDRNSNKVSSSTSLDGYYYVGKSSLENYNTLDGKDILTNPTGSNTIEPDSEDYGNSYIYQYDGVKSNNIIILIDNIDSAYATNDPIHISHDMDAWVYAPYNDVIIDSGVNVTGGVIANNVTLKSGAEINGVIPNEGFINMLKSKYVNISWMVTYE